MKLFVEIELTPLYKLDTLKAGQVIKALEDITEVKKLLKINFLYHSLNSTKIWFDKNELHNKLGTNFIPSLKFNLDFKNNEITQKEEIKRFKEEEKSLNITYNYEEMFACDTMAWIKEEIFYLLVLSNIAIPGGIIATRGEMVANDGLREEKFNIGNSQHRYLLEKLEADNWIKFRNIGIVDVIKWFKKNQFDFHEFSSSSKTHCALNAFTYLFHVDHDFRIANLIWSMVGIEALYCNNSNSISEQIHTKTQLVFGKRRSFIKKLRNMYQFRSRLLHGDISIPACENRMDYDHKTEKDLFEYEALSIGILTGSLQELVLRDINSFNFELRLI